MSNKKGFLDNLPVIGDYRDKEKRRHADKKLRKALARSLKNSRRRLTALQRDLVSAGKLGSLMEMERAVGRTQLLIDRIRTASYGYAGQFATDSIRETELDQLLAFDQAIGAQLPVINEHIDELESTIQAGEAHEAALMALMEALATLHEQYDQRDLALHAS